MASSARLEWRPIVPADAKSWSELLAECEAVDGGWVYFSEEVLIEDFDDPDTDFERGSVVIYDGCSIVGYGVLTSRSHADQGHEMRLEGAVHPVFRRHGVGSALLGWAETAAVAIHRDGFSGRPLSLSATCMSTNHPANALFAGRDYQPSRWFHAMVRDLRKPLPEAPTPAGVQIIGFGPERREDARTVRNEAFRDHWGSTELTVDGWAHFMDFTGFRPQLSFLAYAGGEPIGVIISHEYDQPTEAAGVRDAYIAVVATRRAARNRGIASALLSRALDEATTAGFTSASLGVDADSMTGAVDLYTRAGFSIHHTTITHTKTLPS